MTKTQSFFASMAITIILYIGWYKGYITGWIMDKQFDTSTINEAAFLILWYMLWKLLHDKQKA